MTTRVVVIGASGFGRESLDVLEAMIRNGSDIEVLGVVDDGASSTNLERLAVRVVPFLGTREEWLGSAPPDIEFVLGIGNPGIRRRLTDELEVAGRQAFTAVHPSVKIGGVTTIGQGSVICAGVSVSNNVRIGKHVHVNPNATVGHDAVLGDFVSVNPAAVISGEVLVREGALVGAGAVVLQGLEVGRGSVVGAGAVVTKRVDDYKTVVGVPARPL